MGAFWGPFICSRKKSKSAQQRIAASVQGRPAAQKTLREGCAARIADCGLRMQTAAARQIGSWPGLAGIGRAGTGWDGLGRARPVCGGSPPTFSAASKQKAVTKRPSNSRRRAHSAAHSAPNLIAAKPVKPCDGGVFGAFYLPSTKEQKAPRNGLPPACKGGQRCKKTLREGGALRIADCGLRMQLAICKCSQPPPGRSARGSWSGLAGIGRAGTGRASLRRQPADIQRRIQAKGRHETAIKQPPPRRFLHRFRHPFRRLFRSQLDSSQARQTVRWGRFWGLLFAPEKRAKAPRHGLPPACKGGQRRRKRCVKAARRGLRIADCGLRIADCGLRMRMQPTAARQIGSWFVACGWNGPGWAGMGRNGPEWAGMGRNGPEWAGMGRNGPEWAGIGRNRPEWDGMGRAGTGWDGLGRARPVCGGSPTPFSAASKQKAVTKRPSNSRRRAGSDSGSAPNLIAAKPVKPCDGGVLGAFYLLLKKERNAPATGCRQRARAVSGAENAA